MRSLASTCSRPSTAMQATLHSHSQRLEHISNTNPMYDTTTRTYGARHTLEQVHTFQ